MYAEWDKNRTNTWTVPWHYSSSGFPRHQARRVIQQCTDFICQTSLSAHGLQQSRLGRPVAFLYDFHTRWISFLVAHSTNSNWNNHKHFWERNWNWKLQSWTACIKCLWSSVRWAQYLCWDFKMKKKLLLGQGVKIQKSYDIKTQNRWKQGLHLQGCDDGHA